MKRKRQEDYVVDEFNRTAGGYDDSRLVNAFQRRAQVMVIGRMNILKGMDILDLGCGTGEGALDIAVKLEGSGSVTGIDLSEQMIEIAGGKPAKHDINNVIFKVGSGSTLDYEKCFDYVICTNAFHHFQDKALVFHMVYRSLKQGGVFLVQDICDDFLMMKLVDMAGKIGERAHAGSTTSGRMKELLESAGFYDVAVEKVRLNRFWKIMIGEGRKS